MSDNSEINVSREWNFQVNLAGLQAPTGKGGNALPTGYYKVKLADLYINPDKNPNRVIIKAQVAEGPFAGVTRTDGLNMPKSGDDKVRFYWRGLAESCGYGARELDAGEITLSPAAFMNKVAHIHFTAREDAEDGYENILWLAPMEWSQQKQNFEMTGGEQKAEAPLGSTGSALGGSPQAERTIAQPTALGGGGNEGTGNASSVSQLKNMLGVNI